MSLVLRVIAVLLTGLAVFAAVGPSARAQVVRPAGPTQGRVVGAAYVNRAAGYTHELPPSWVSHGYKWYESWGASAAGQRPGAEFVAEWVYVPVDRRKPEAALLAIAVYPAGLWHDVAAQGGPPLGQVLAQTEAWAYVWSGRQDAPYGDGSPDDQQAAALYADVPLVTASFRLLDAAGRPLAEPATQVVPFDPAALPPAPGQPARSAVCGPSAAVPRPGAFACQPEGATDTLDPCFALSDISLACAVNPATGAYIPVAAAGPLPATAGAPAGPVPFHVELDGTKPPCAKRGQPVPIGAYAATYACQAPGAWLVGPLATARPVWIAQYVTSDSQNTVVTYGPEPTRVTRAWVY
jgi:hypothetical protein